VDKCIGIAVKKRLKACFINKCGTGLFRISKSLTGAAGGLSGSDDPLVRFRFHPDAVCRFLQIFANMPFEPLIINML
jgi:hypothetical protein